MRQASPNPPSSWIKRVQHVSLRTKIVVPMVIVAVMPTLIIGTLLILYMGVQLRERVNSRVQFDTASKAHTVQQFINAVQTDLLFISQTQAIRELIVPLGGNGGESIDLREQAEQSLSMFLKGERGVCQVQCLTPVGEQLIRLDVVHDHIQAASGRPLQGPNDPSFTSGISQIKAGDIYTSGMVLDQVHGMESATVKFATAVLTRQQQVGGALVVSVCADHLLAQMGPLPDDMEAWLVGQDGVYLGYVGASDDKRRRYQLLAGRSVTQDYDPQRLATLLTDREGGVLETGDAFVASATVAVNPGFSDQTWTLLVSYPRASIVAPIHRMTMYLSIIVVSGAAVSGLLGGLIVLYLLRPIERLRLATRQIAEGDFTRRVQINTGDEIEALATDFNTMTQRLEVAQHRLTTWNEELEREVARQTRKLRQMQLGLARADKLASLGQMTAGVLHEVGNPLAAIKSSIQVAEEEQRFNPACQALFGKILRQLDRLAAFLHSFSRLSKHPPPQLQPISLAAVIAEVADLVTLELKRKGLTLRVQQAADLPRVHGDPQQLQQVLINLILNAKDASPPDSEILIRAYPAAGATTGSTNADGPPRVCLEVIDHGSGVPPQLLEQIWHPLFTTKADGTGLGLAICRKIVHDHGAAIRVKSQVGKGTTMTIVFAALTPGVPNRGAKPPPPTPVFHGAGEGP